MPLKSAEIKSRPTAMTLDEGEVKNILSEHTDAEHCVIEKQSSRPGEGPVGAFSLGFNYGKIVGILAALKIPFTVMSAKRWRSMSLHPYFGLLYERVGNEAHDFEGKDISIQTAISLYPDYKMPTLKPKGKKLHDGIAESMLMADAARQTLINIDAV